MLQKAYILESAPTGQELASRADEAIREVGHVLGQNYAYQGAEDNEEGIVAHTWVELIDEQNSIQVVADEVMPAKFVIVNSTCDKDIADIERELSRRLPFVDEAGLLAAARVADSDPGALQRLGIALEGAVNGEGRRLLVEGLSSHNIEVRYNAAVGASFVGSKDLVDALKSALEREGDEGMHGVLDHAIQACSRES